jgi:hypothetical protein
VTEPFLHDVCVKQEKLYIERIDRAETQVVEWRDKIRTTGYDGADELVQAYATLQATVARLTAAISNIRSDHSKCSADYYFGSEDRGDNRCSLCLYLDNELSVRVSAPATGAEKGGK